MNAPILKEVFEKKDRDYTTNLFHSFANVNGTLLDWDECSSINEMEEDYMWLSRIKRGYFVGDGISRKMHF